MICAMDGKRLQEIEIAQINLRYAHTRIERPETVRALAASIERAGQTVPVIVLQSRVLLDGYLRVQALERLGRHTVMAEIWEGTEEDALMEIIARSHTRRWDVFEEAALLAALQEQHHLSQERIASRVGHRQSWVSGRLALYHALTEDLIALIRKGAVSTWTVTRVIVPIARAIPEHGKLLTEHLPGASTREMAQFFRHYRKATRRQRENMVREPALFFAALRAKEEDREAGVLKEGPEGAYLRDLRIITHMLKGLLKDVPLLFSSDESTADRRLLVAAFRDSRKHFAELEHAIGRYHDERRDDPDHAHPRRAGGSHPGDRPDADNLPEHGERRHPGERTHPSGIPA